MRALRLALVVVFAVVLGSSQVSALPSREGTARSEVKNYTRGVLVLLSSFLAEVWNKAGCEMDPLGRCAAAVAPATDAGCGMDPLGRCGS